MAQGLVQVIRHVAFEDLGNLEPILQNWGFEIQYLEAGDDELPVSSVSLDADILIILGGPIPANDDKSYACLAQEMSILEKRIASDLPILGICLGAQLIARVLGSRVYSGNECEIGWSGLEITEMGLQHCIRYLSQEKTSVFHWHNEVFELPKNAIRLASTVVCQEQAFSYGSALALQFHPEICPGHLEQWFIGYAHEILLNEKISLDKLRQDSHDHIYNLQSQAILFWQGWLSSIL